MKNESMKSRGFSIVELLLTLGIISILVGTALPEFSRLVDQKKIDTASIQLRSILQLSRKTAITQNKKVTLCPTLDANQCTNDWSSGYIAFIDENEDRSLDSHEKVIYQGSISAPEVKLRWRAFGQRDSLQWHETGITNHQNGSFEFCFRDEPKLARALIITKAGRIRASKDENGDDIHENSTGENLNCW